MQDQELLQKIYQEANSSIYSIQTMASKITDNQVTAQLSAYQTQLETISRTAQHMMENRGISYRKSDVMSRLGIWTGIQLNSLMDSSPSHFADMVIQGNIMGITQMMGAINYSPLLDSSIRELGNRFISLQQRNIHQMQRYL